MTSFTMLARNPNQFRSMAIGQEVGIFIYRNLDLELNPTERISNHLLKSRGTSTFSTIFSKTVT